MGYESIGLSGTDLLFLSPEKRSELLGRLSRFPDNVVLSMATDLQINKAFVMSMIQEEIIVPDKTSGQYADLLKSMSYFESKYMKAKQKQEVEEDDFLMAEFGALEETAATNEFGLELDTEDPEDSDDDLVFDELLEELESSDLPDVIESEYTSMHRKLFEEYPEHSAKSKKIDEENFLSSMQEDYCRLPRVFNEEKESPPDSELETYARRYICSIAEAVIGMEDLLSDMFKSQNRLENSLGMPNDMRCTSNYAIQYMVNYTNGLNRDSRKNRVRNMSNSLTQLISGSPKKSGSREDDSERDMMLMDMKGVFGEKSNKVSFILNNPKIQDTIMFYYSIYQDLRKFKSKVIFDGSDNYSAKERGLSQYLVKNYGVIGYIPCQMSILIRNYPSLPGEGIEGGEPLTTTEKDILRIFRNSMLSERSFRSRR